MKERQKYTCKNQKGYYSEQRFKPYSRPDTLVRRSNTVLHPTYTGRCLRRVINTETKPYAEGNLNDRNRTDSYCNC